MNQWNITAREGEVIEALISEGTAKRAARKLQLSFHTVNWHLKMAKVKMKTQHSVTLAAMWVRHLNTVVAKQGITQ